MEVKEGKELKGINPIPWFLTCIHLSYPKLETRYNAFRDGRLAKFALFVSSYQ